MLLNVLNGESKKAYSLYISPREITNKIYCSSSGFHTDWSCNCSLVIKLTLVSGVNNTLIHPPISKRETGKSNFIASVNQTLFVGQVKAKGCFFKFSF